MPILKQLVSGSSQTKRRSRVDLTREMISAPLGDFRHTMHVGRSGDAFGDTSFLSTRSGEPSAAAPHHAEPSFPRSPRPGLLSRTFRSSKRSQSVTRVDGQDGGDGGGAFVKNAMSLPFLNNEEDGGRTEGVGVPKSLSISPVKQLGDLDLRPSNGAAAAHSLELDERSFGELTELPGNLPHYGGGGAGMKRADSVMSFHVDLGPSMLGDILDVMQKEEDDLGYEEGEGRVSPPLSVRGEEPGVVGEEVEEEKEEMEEEEEGAAPVHPPGSADLERESGGPYTPEFTPETRPRRLQHLDSCSVSSSGSAPLEDRPIGQNLGGDADSANFSAPPEEEGHFSSFMEDDEDDEIRV